MAAKPLGALAQYLGEVPSKAALYPGSRQVTGQRAAAFSSVRRRSVAPDDDSSDGDSHDGVPRYDGGFDDGCKDDTAAPFSNPKQQYLREFDEPKSFNCSQPHVPVSQLAPKRPSGVQLGLEAGGGSSGSSGASQARGAPPRGSSELPPQRAAPRGALRPSSLGETATPAPGGFASFLKGGGPEQPEARGASAAAAGGKMKARGCALPGPGAALGGRSESAASLGCSVRDLDLMGSTSRRRFGGRA